MKTAMSDRPQASSPFDALSEQSTASIVGLFDRDPDRLDRLTIDVGGIHFDFSKTHLDSTLLDAFAEIRQALKIADYVYVLELGRNRFEGPVEEFDDLKKAFWV